MAGDLLADNGYSFVVGDDLKGLTDLFHLLGNGISPKCVAIFPVKFIGIAYSLRYFNPKFMCSLKVAG